MAESLLSEFVKKCEVDCVGSHRCQAQFQRFEHIYKFGAVDEFDWWYTITGSLPASLTCESPSCNQDSFIGSALHRASKVSNLGRRHGLQIALTLEQDFETHLNKSRLSQKALTEPLK